MQRLINVYLVALVATTTFFVAQAGPAEPAEPPLTQSDIIFSADLTDGTSLIADGWQISWMKSLGSEKGDCDLQGVVKITFPPPINGQQNCKLKFDLTIRESDLDNDEGWVFDIGDSTNNGFGGAAGDSSNSAEIHNLRDRILVYSNALPGYEEYGVEQSLKVEDTEQAMSQYVTVTVGDELVEFDNHRGIKKSYQSPYLFTLNGQMPTKGSVNRDIFFSMNRVVYPYSYTSRTGVGLCKAVIKAVNCDPYQGSDGDPGAALPPGPA